MHDQKCGGTLSMNLEKISFKPLLQDIYSYTFSSFRKDTFSAFAVMLISIPHAIAYSIVAGLPPYCGVFSTIVGTALSALLGSSRQLIVGPSNATTLLVQTAALDILSRYYQGAEGIFREQISLEFAGLLALLIGLFQMFAALFHFSRVVTFVSYPVVIAYISGAAVALSVDQLFNFFGIERQIGATSIYEKMQVIVLHIHRITPVTALIGLLSFFLLIVLRRIRMKIPTTLVVVIFVTMLVHGFGLQNIVDSDGRGLALVGEDGVMNTIIPPIQLPNHFRLRLLNELVPAAFAIALIGMLETTAIAKNIATHTGQQLHNNQEILGLGVSNTLLSFFGTLPCSGSSFRTLVNYESGAVTRMSAIMSGLFFAIFVLFFGKYIQYIPLATLSALVIATAVRMIDKTRIRQCMLATRSDAIVLFITFFSCIIFDLKVAFYVGSTLSILLYLKRAASPQVIEYFFNPDSHELRPITEEESQEDRPIRIINVEGDLFFGAADIFQSTMRTMTEGAQDTKVVILRFKHVRDIDVTAIIALKQLHDFLTSTGRKLLIASIPRKIHHIFEHSGLDSYLGKENLFVLDGRHPQNCMRTARAHAIALIEDVPISTY